MEQGFFLRHKKELGASIKRTIIINISFIIHMIFERAFANQLKKYITILFTGIFIWFFRGVFEEILFAYSKNHVFSVQILILTIG